MDVVVPPDILNGPDGNDGATMTDEGSIPENGTVKLSCIATGVPKPTVQWRREGGRDIIMRSEGGSGRDNKHGENPTLVNGVDKGGRRHIFKEGNERDKKDRGCVAVGREKISGSEMGIKWIFKEREWNSEYPVTLSW